MSTVFTLSLDWSGTVLGWVFPSQRKFREMIKLSWLAYPMYGAFPDKAKAIQRFEAHNEQVKATIPADRLLVFQATDGWGPLCKFLEVPVPNKPYPKVNEADDLQARLQKARTTASIVLAVPTITAIGLAYYYMPQFL